MSYVKWKIENTPFIDGAWDDSQTTEITSFYSPLLRVNTGTKKDSFQFKVINNSLIENTTFGVDNKITIYRTANTDTITTDDILMVGAIRDIPINQDGMKNIYDIKGYNFSETVLKAIVFVDLEQVSIAAGIQEALEQVAGMNSNFKVTWSATNPTSKQSAGKEGDPFPLVGEKFFYKPLKDILEKYSTNDRTEDGNYFWYINKDNELLWFQQDSVPLYTFDSSIDAHKSIKVKKDIKGVRNYIIAKAGYDPAGNQIMTKFIDWSSVGRHGMKYYFLTTTNTLAQELRTEDNEGVQTAITGYPDSMSASAFTTKWRATVDATVGAGTTMTDGEFVTVNQGSLDNNKKDYTAVIRTETKARAEKEGQAYADAHKYGKLVVDLEFSAGIKPWSLGDRVNCSIPELSQVDKEMRVIDIQYGNDTDIYSLEEDEGSL